MAISSTVMAYAAKAPGNFLELFEYEAPPVGPDEVMVSVTHCGLCHTDIQAIDDFYKITEYPFVPGHEIVGKVSEVGGGVTGLKVGDRVGIGWQGHSCGKCEYCLKGEVHLCRKIAECGTWTPCGGFGSSVVVDHRFAYLLPGALPAEHAAVLMCAGISVFSPLRKFSQPAGQKLAILGIGGLGHLAIQFAHAFGYDVTVVSTSPEKKAQALAFGADEFFLASDELEYDRHIFYYDIVLCTAPGKVPWELLLNIPKKTGRIILVSFPVVEMNPVDLVAHELNISGSFLGTPATMREMLSFAQANHITPMVELTPMEKVNDAVQRVRENKARYRIVLVNEHAL
jgi:alcohol/geraniol dehydrogenase (NADP+)